MSAARRCIFQGFTRTLYWRHQGTTNCKEPAPRFAAAAAAAQLCGRGAAALRFKSSAPGGVREQTLIAVKPDGVQRRLVGKIIQLFEQRGFKLVALKMLQVPDDLLAQHYSHLRTKPFYPRLQDYMTSGPVVAMVWEGHNVVQTSRNMVGNTDPVEARPGTIRGDFSIHVSRNVVHASDSVEGAEREIKLWFEEKELVRWSSYDQKFIHES